MKYAAGLALAITAFVHPQIAMASSPTNQTRRALQQLVAQHPVAATCKSKAAAVLVFSDVVKEGFIFEAQGRQQGLMAGLGLQGAKITRID